MVHARDGSFEAFTKIWQGLIIAMHAVLVVHIYCELDVRDENIARVAVYRIVHAIWLT